MSFEQLEGVGQSGEKFAGRRIPVAVAIKRDREILGAFVIPEEVYATLTVNTGENRVQARDRLGCEYLLSRLFRQKYPNVDISTGPIRNL